MRRTSRTSRALGALLALSASTVACSSAPGTGVTEPPGTLEPTTAPTTTIAGPLADQTPPLSTFGLAFHNMLLWVADFHGGQVLAVDPDSGAIIRRLQSIDGVSPEVNDVAVAKDGTIFWIGFNDGQVAVLPPSNAYRTFAQVTPGTYAIALSPDGKKLYAGGAIGKANSVWTMDLTFQERGQPKAPQQVALRSFDVSDDGLLYGPRFGSSSARPGVDGALVRVNPVTGEFVDLVSNLDGPIAVKLSPDNKVAYVLSLPPGGKPKLSAIDLTTRLSTDLPPLRTALADNLAIADDGRIFVSSFNESVINVLGADGAVKTLQIGQRPIAPGS
jgi:DNA-binding beta-propeller fold protein YncE